MGDLRNCPECGKVFVKINKNLCLDCIEKEEAEFEEVRKYLKDNPKAPVEEIVEITGVQEKKVLRWMREGRVDISFFDGSKGLTCKSCGTVIKTGNFCAKCAKDLSAQMKGAAGQRTIRQEEPEKEKKRGMYFANRMRDN
ncbi:TIGR03826 family flagellar region protein [Phosphitispora sp. TUW77]|uniref:TIGR03826 family flagellar region protein n=1 Tax=Phosphitispora sp. TUW77 TaxID=3152361 RepID=UPI003AB4E8F4